MAASGPTSGPPARPSWREERPAAWCFRAFGPRVPRLTAVVPPEQLAPFEALGFDRPGGQLSATLYPAPASARGLVLLVHPWLEWGQAYFHRRGRIEALRKADYHALSVDLGGFGNTRRAPGFLDRDIEIALSGVAGRWPGLPVHLWGVSSGGYWAHPVLARSERVIGACFEDVSPHLLEWSGRRLPWARPAFALFRGVFTRAHRYLDLRRHAPYLRARAIAYVGGELDPGIAPGETRALAALARARVLLVPGAGHLAAIKRAPAEVIGLALETFERATSGSDPNLRRP